MKISAPLQIHHLLIPTAAAAAAAVHNNDDSSSTILRAAIIALPPYAVKKEENETTDGSWSGFMFDLANLLMTNAKSNHHNISLDINFDTENGVLNRPPNNLSYNDALERLSSDCVESTTSSGGCYDIIFADYYETEARSQLVHFTPPYQISYNTYFKKDSSNALNTAEEVNEVGGSCCLIEGTPTYETISPKFNTVTACDDSYDCYGKLMAGECNLFAGDVLIGGYQIKDAYPNLTITGEVIDDMAFKLALPMRSDLDETALQLMSDLMTEATASGELGDVEKKYFGRASDIAALEKKYFGEVSEEDSSSSSSVGEQQPSSGSPTISKAACDSKTSLLFAAVSVVFATLVFI